MVEQWRQVAGFSGLYEVSNHGKIRSIKQRRGALAGRILSPGRVGRGRYAQVILFDRSRHYRMVHRLVLEAFIGPCPTGMEGCHKDDDTDNNHVENLFWGTHLENCAKFTGQGNPMSLTQRERRMAA